MLIIWALHCNKVAGCQTLRVIWPRVDSNPGRSWLHILQLEWPKWWTFSWELCDFGSRQLCCPLNYNTDLLLIAFKDLIPFQSVSKVQVAGSILKVGLAISRWPHFYRVYLVTVCKRSSIAVHVKIGIGFKKDIFWGISNFI